MKSLGRGSVCVSLPSACKAVWENTITHKNKIPGIHLFCVHVSVYKKTHTHTNTHKVTEKQPISFILLSNQIWMFTFITSLSQHNSLSCRLSLSLSLCRTVRMTGHHANMSGVRGHTYSRERERGNRKTRGTDCYWAGGKTEDRKMEVWVMDSYLKLSSLYTNKVLIQTEMKPDRERERERERH